MKKKNPLYVVKGKDVEEAKSLMEMVVKKFNLGPVLSLLKNIMDFLLKEIQSYAVLRVVKNWLDELVRVIHLLTRRFGLSV